MKEFIGFAIFILIVTLPALAVQQPVSEIVIDGDLSDWAGIDPVIVEETVEGEHSFDIQSGFLAANDSHLFIRIDYADGCDEMKPYMDANLTIRIPNGSVYIVMCQINYDVTPQSPCVWIFVGKNLESPVNSEVPDLIAYHDEIGWGMVDWTTNNSLEFTFLLSDLGFDKGALIDVTFWHLYNYDMSGLLYNKAGTVYDILLGDYPSSSTNQTGTTSRKSYSLITIPGFQWVFGITFVITSLIVVIRRQRIL